jgi:hypothetical protein
MRSWRPIGGVAELWRRQDNIGLSLIIIKYKYGSRTLEIEARLCGPMRAEVRSALAERRGETSQKRHVQHLSR